MKLIAKLISELKNEEYNFNQKINNIDIVIILLEKFIQLLRGEIRGLFFKKKRGLAFIGKNVKIKHSNKLQCGKNLFVGDNSYLNLLCEEGVILGDNVSLGQGTTIICTGVIRNLGSSLKIGSRVGFSNNCLLNVRGEVVIGNDCIFGPNVSIVSENHNYKNLEIPIRLQGENRKGVYISDNCWIGMNVTILDGVTIGQGSVIGAGSVVNKNIPENSVYAGVPAKLIYKRE